MGQIASASLVIYFDKARLFQIKIIVARVDWTKRVPAAANCP